MKNIIVTFLLAISSALLYSQTAKEIIDKNIEFSGGLTQWKLLNSVIKSISKDLILPKRVSLSTEKKLQLRASMVKKAMR